MVATCPSIEAARFAFRLYFILFVFVVCSFLSGEQKQSQGRGLVDRKLVQDLTNLGPFEREKNAVKTIQFSCKIPRFCVQVLGGNIL